MRLGSESQVGALPGEPATEWWTPGSVGVWGLGSAYAPFQDRLSLIGSQRCRRHAHDRTDRPERRRRQDHLRRPRGHRLRRHRQLGRPG